MPSNLARLIDAKVRQYANDPSSLRNNGKSLKGGDGLLRLRVGDWRVIFQEDDTVVAVVRIAPRSGAYD